MRTISVASLLATTLALVSKTFAEPDPNYHIYLSFGQSNMYGAGPIEDQDLTVDSRFQMLSSCTCGERQLGEWYDAVPPLADCGAALGPTDYFGRTLVEALPDVKVGVTVVAVPGCDIQLFEKDNYQNYEYPDWMESFIVEYGGSPYDRLVELAKKAQESGVIKGILLHQGETNNTQEDWPLRVKAIYENLLNDLGLKAEEVPLLVGELVQLSENGTCGAHNAVIQTVPDVIPTAHVISSEGLKQQGDGFHFTSESNRIFGKRYAEVMLELLNAGTPIEDEQPIEVETDVDIEGDEDSESEEETEIVTEVVTEVETEVETEFVEEDVPAPAPPTGGKKVCWSEKLGYPCCYQGSEIVYTDSDGNWGILDGSWCGIVL